MLTARSFAKKKRTRKPDPFLITPCRTGRLFFGGKLCGEIQAVNKISITFFEEAQNFTLVRQKKAALLNAASLQGGICPQTPNLASRTGSHWHRMVNKVFSPGNSELTKERRQ
jgi:hypothetical protein